MTDYEMLIVILTFGILIVSIIALCHRTRNKPYSVHEAAAYLVKLQG